MASGDDLLVSVKHEIGHQFNNITYQKYCQEVYNIPYTSASKGNELTPFIDIYSCSFLKRTFRFDVELDRWVAPLSLDSVYKSLIWFIPSSSVPREEQLMSTMRSALWELSLHVDERTYRVIKQKFVELLKELNEFYTDDLPERSTILNQMFNLNDSGFIAVPEVESASITRSL